MRNRYVWLGRGIALYATNPLTLLLLNINIPHSAILKLLFHPLALYIYCFTVFFFSSCRCYMLHKYSEQITAVNQNNN